MPEKSFGGGEIPKNHASTKSSDNGRYLSLGISEVQGSVFSALLSDLSDLSVYGSLSFSGGSFLTLPNYLLYPNTQIS